MWFIEEKLAARIRELEAYRYRDAFVLKGMRMKLDPDGEIGEYPPDSDDGWEPVRQGDRWQGRDCYAWLALDVFIPQHWQGRKVLGRFDFGRTGGGGNSGFESLLYLNGRPYQGVDSNHEEVFMPEASIGTCVRLCFRLWSGLNGYGTPKEMEHTLSRAELCWLDESADDLFYTARASLETVRLMGEDRPEREAILGALDRAFLLVDWSEPGSESFYTSLSQARDTLRSGLAGQDLRHPVTIQCVGHTHIDVAWLWRIRHTREKAARSFSTVLRLMELYPEYTFLQTQPQLYEYMKSDYPELYAQIRERVREGRWEPGGGMWLEADCNLPSGESLVRQLLYGIRFLQQEFGMECTYLWLPDVFGYSWSLPQILRKSGIEAFMTTKISWNQYNRMPHDTFMWRGIDGTEILTHFITTPAEGDDEGLLHYTYNGKITPQSVQGIWNAYRDKALNQTLLLAYGYGDGGGGVNREMLEMRRRLEGMPGMPKVVTGRADDYFRELRERVSATDRYVHVWDGEMYLELHRGTYTSQAAIKRMNRKLELLYRETEWLGVLGCLFGGGWQSYPEAELREGWKIVLRNQFHDIIPGSSIREVYEDSMEEYADARMLGRRLWNGGARSVVGGAGDGSDGAASSSSSSIRYALFNSASWPRSGLVRIPVEEGMDRGCWIGAGGLPLEAQRTAEGWLVHAEQLPPMGFAGINFQREEDREEKPPTSFTYKDGRLETPYYIIEWNESGLIAGLYDKQAQRSILAPGALGNALQVFEDKPKGRHEAWDIDIFYREKMTVVSNLISMEVIESGTLRFVLRFVWTYGKSVIQQDLKVYSRSRRIDFDTQIDWHERRKLLKAAFPVDIRATEATYDIQFGNVRRPTHWNTSWDYARFESVGHQWADLSECGYGVSLLNDCKYGYDIKDHVIRLSLVKSAMVPDADADQGEHRFTYSLYPHLGDWRDGGTVQEAWALNQAIAAVEGVPIFPSWSLMYTECDHIQIDAVKKAEDRDTVIVRFHEYKGARGTAVLGSDIGIKAWRETDLLERPEEPWRTEEEIRLTVLPYEIKTLEIQLYNRAAGPSASY